MGQKHDPKGQAHPLAETVSMVQWSPESVSGVRPRPGEYLGGRFVLRRFLGEGGMGAVFEADDLELGGQVAVKVLTRASASAVYALKNEFRALQDVVHPHLVRLLELSHTGQRWFVVMDLVRGSVFSSFVRAAGGPARHARLRTALLGVARGVDAIHRVGKLHRDLKPSNVLVTDEGHAVIVDLGLVSGQRLGEPGQTQEGVFAGTPAYASPEQLAGRELSPASDWYAVGLMLYEALTGQLPNEPLSRFKLSEHDTFQPPHRLAPDVPPDLDALCMRLLAFDPAQRPRGEQVLAELGEVADALAPRTASALAATFVGRAEELALLEEALTETRRGKPRALFVHGPSGMGKSTLVARFVERARQERTLVLSGRCYPREQVPFKAFDAIIDQISHLLARLPEVEAARLLPRDTAELTRMFPTLSRLSSVLRAPERLESGAPDAQRCRELAFRAFKELLARVADRWPLVLCIDDLQWGDADSAQLFRELVSPPDAPALLVLCTYRSEERLTSPMLAELLDDADALPGARFVELGPLSASEATELATRMASSHPARADQIAREAGGVPFFVGELARHAEAFGVVGSVGSAVTARVATLQPAVQGLLELVCVADRPLATELVTAASGVNDAAAVRTLVDASLLRIRQSDDATLFEPYHGRVADAVLARLDEARVAELNLALARAYESAGSQDPEALVQCYLRAGRRAEAARFARQAASRASAALAFARAAELLQIASEHQHEADGELLVALGDARQNAGQPMEAAASLERAAELVAPAEAEVLERRAMRLYLQAGHLERGRAILVKLCRRYDLALPRWRGWLVWSVWVRWLWHRLRPALISRLATPASMRLGPQRAAFWRGRFELTWSAAVGLTSYAPELGAWLFLHAFEAARRLGGREELALSASMDEFWKVFMKRRPDQASHTARAEQIVAMLGSSSPPEVIASVRLFIGTMHAFLGRMDRAHDDFVDAEQRLVAQGLAVPPACASLRGARLTAGFFVGELGAALRSAPHWLREARDAKDVFNEVMIEVSGSHHHLVADAPDAARAALDASFARALPFEHPLSGALWWRALPDLYSGRPEQALALARAVRGTRGYRVIRNFAHNRVLFALTEAQAYGQLLAADANSKDARSGLQRQLERVQREHVAPAAAVSAQIVAMLAAARGARDQAITALARAAVAYRTCGHLPHAAACDARRGQLLGDRELERASLAVFSAQGVARPDRWIDMLVPMRA